MNAIPTYQHEFDAAKACVLIPTFNNAGTLARVISDVLEYTSNVIVVNDGSTDDTKQIIESFPGVEKVSYKKKPRQGLGVEKGLSTCCRPRL